jgi:hypothetical protein
MPIRQGEREHLARRALPRQEAATIGHSRSLFASSSTDSASDCRD